MSEETTPVVEIAFTKKFVDVLATGPTVAAAAGASPGTVAVLKAVARMFAESDNNPVITKREALKRDDHLILGDFDSGAGSLWRVVDLVTNDTDRAAIAAAAEEMFELTSGSDLIDALRSLSTALVEDPETLVFRIVYERPRPLNAR